MERGVREVPSIRVELVDGTGTWVSYLPIRQLDAMGAITTAGEVAALFVANLARDEVVLNERLGARRG